MPPHHRSGFASAAAAARQARVAVEEYAWDRIEVDGRPGMGWVRDPKRAAYNAVYKRTTFSVWDLFR